MTRDDDVRQELEQVRKRRLEAGRLEAELAREQASLEAALRPVVGLDERYGALASVADLPAVIHEWRRHIPAISALSEAVDPGRDHVRGDPAAPVVVVEYGDYQCVECAEAHDLYARIHGWLDDGQLCAVFRHFPLVDAHPLALRAAQAAEAAAAQGQFWQLHDALMQHDLETDDQQQQHIMLKTPRTEAELVRVARRAGLDVERFRADIDDEAALARIHVDFRSGLASGVSGTPTFYVNGRRTDSSGVDELYDAIASMVAG